MKAQLMSTTLSLSVIYTKPEGRWKSVVTIYCEGTSSARPHWSMRNMGSRVMVPREKRVTVVYPTNPLTSTAPTLTH